MAVTAKQIQKVSEDLEGQLYILESYRDAKEAVLANEQNREYPNADREEALEEQAEILDDAICNLQEAIDRLREY